MKRLLLFGLFCFFLFASPTTAQEVRPISYEDRNVCTAFPVAPYYWITANHCNLEGILLDGKPVEVINADDKADLVLLKADVSAKGLTIAKKEAAQGDTVRTKGYLLGLSQPLAWEGVVSHPSINPSLLKGWPERNVMLVTPNFTGGASGAPLLNANGEVVGVAVGGGSGSTVMIGTATTLKDLRKFLGMKN